MKRIEPGPGQESVWDYPRPPAVEPVGKVIEVVFDGRTLCETSDAFRVLETSHPPVYYLPRADFDETMLRDAEGGSFCEWKGMARYFDVVGAGRVAEKAGWSYPQPTERFACIRDHIALYAGPMDRCTVGGLEAEPQPGGFYGGWVTPNVVGPFKGGPGTWGW